MIYISKSAVLHPAPESWKYYKNAGNWWTWLGSIKTQVQAVQFQTRTANYIL